MTNSNLFKSKATPKPKAEATDTINAAGGRAYSRSSEEALAQYAVTGTFGTTFYVNEEDHLSEVNKHLSSCSPEFAAKVAVYGRNNGKMKDVPVYILAYLAHMDKELFKKVYPKVVKTGKDVRNLYTFFRSGQILGKTNIPAVAVKMVDKWLLNTPLDKLFWNSVGGNNNSLSFKDILRFNHAASKAKGADNEMRRKFFYKLSECQNSDSVPLESLPDFYREYKNFDPETSESIPKGIPFEMLRGILKKKEHWVELSKSMTFSQIRQSLNNLLEKGVLDEVEVKSRIVEMFSSEEVVRKSGVMPLQMFSTLSNVKENVPNEIFNALQQGLGVSFGNIPKISGNVFIGIDVSGSMGNSYSGSRGNSPASKITCLDVAALFAAALVKANPETKVVLFDTSARYYRLNTKDSVFTIAKEISKNLGGGTDVATFFNLIKDEAVDTAIVISDNESWYNQPNSYCSNKTQSQKFWNKIKEKNQEAKAFLIDIRASSNTQLKESMTKGCYNIGGFNDSVFEIINTVLETEGKKNFLSVIEEISL